jgi:hypothetical protein
VLLKIVEVLVKIVGLLLILEQVVRAFRNEK